MGTNTYISGGCFPKTMRIVMTDGTLRPIWQLKIGDTVRSRNSEGRPTSSKVTKTGNYRAYTILLNGILEATEDQPMLSGSGKWVTIGNLCTGDELLDDQNKLWKINERTPSNAKVEVFWIEVEPFHVYAVENIWAHNKIIPAE